MDDPLAILIVHRMGDPLRRRKAVEELELQLPLTLPQHNYIVHDDDLPFPDYLREFEFDGIVLGPTFLCNRHVTHQRTRTEARYAFLRDTSASTIALPQDDYDTATVLDRWMTTWRLDRVYTVCPEHWSLLYPTYLASGGRLELGYTGYVSDSMIRTWSAPKPFDRRGIDVSYRAHGRYRNFGTLGRVKARIGSRFAARIGSTDLVLDISTHPGDFLAGDQWRDFLESSRFCLATNSGSSLLDRDGDIRKAVERYQLLHPDATFEDVEAHCYPGEDGRHVFTALSPRNLEAALALTVQLATPGPYSGILEPEEHYIPLEPDCSNLADVLAAMKDEPRVRRIARQCKETVLDRPELRASTQATRLIDGIRQTASSLSVANRQARFDQLRWRYTRDILGSAERLWARKRLTRRIKNAAIRFGGQRVKAFLSDPAARPTVSASRERAKPGP